MHRAAHCLFLLSMIIVMVMTVPASEHTMAANVKISSSVIRSLTGGKITKEQRKAAIDKIKKEAALRRLNTEGDHRKKAESTMKSAMSSSSSRKLYKKNPRSILLRKKPAAVKSGKNAIRASSKATSATKKK